MHAALPGLRLSDSAARLPGWCVGRISLPVRLSPGNDLAGAC
jgi:hypothetical protein